MDREQIAKLIQENKLTRSTPGLPGVLVRTFEQLRELDAMLSGFDQGIQDGAALEREVQRLEQENPQLESKIVECNTQVVKLGKEMDTMRRQSQGNVAVVSKESQKLASDLKEVETECTQLKSEIAQLEGKPAEMERLKRRRDELQEVDDQLNEKIVDLGEEYQRNVDLLGRLRPFVERMEQLENQMAQTMDDLWSDFKKDAFDRMC